LTLNPSPSGRGTFQTRLLTGDGAGMAGRLSPLFIYPLKPSSIGNCTKCYNMTVKALTIAEDGRCLHPLVKFSITTSNRRALPKLKIDIMITVDPFSWIFWERRLESSLRKLILKNISGSMCAKKVGLMRYSEM